MRGRPASEIDTTIMCRVPVPFLLSKARHMYQQYLAICLDQKEEPETVEINSRWLRRWLIEVRLSCRQPNAVAQERIWE